MISNPLHSHGRGLILDNLHDILERNLRLFPVSDLASLVDFSPDLDDGILNFVVGLVHDASRPRSFGGPLDEIGFHKLALPDPNTLEIRGLVVWEPGYWIEPFYAKLWLDPSSQAEIGYKVHFGASEEPSIKFESKEHNELINEIVMASQDNLSERENWAFSFQSSSKAGIE